jgi:hypothetical protein
LEWAANLTNSQCDDPDYERNALYHLNKLEGKEKCKMRLTRPLPFRTGRRDCVPDEDKKWTPYGFEATKKERHSNAYDHGNQVADDLKRDFGLTAKESISLMAIHGLAQFGKNGDEGTFYKWIGGHYNEFYGRTGSPKSTFSNMYFKALRGKSYGIGGGVPFEWDGLFVGDAKGEPFEGSAFSRTCLERWNNTERYYSGPCVFRATSVGCVPKG